MSRTLKTRLNRLEARNASHTSSGVVVIPWREWPETEEAWEALRRAHPGPRLFVPSQMTFEEWEANVPAMQAR